MRGYAFVLELGEVFCPDVGGGEHHVDIVGGEGGCAFGPVVDNFEGDFQAFVAVDGFGGGVQTAVGDQAAYAAYPDVDAHADVFFLWRAGGGEGQGFRWIDRGCWGVV